MSNRIGPVGDSWIGCAVLDRLFPIQKHRPEARRQQGRPRRNHNTPHSLRRSDSTARGLTPREQPEPTTSLTRPGSRASPCVGAADGGAAIFGCGSRALPRVGATPTTQRVYLPSARRVITYTRGTRSQACHTAALLTPCVPVLLANISSIGSSCTGSLTMDARTCALRCAEGPPMSPTRAA